VDLGTTARASRHRSRVFRAPARRTIPGVDIAYLAVTAVFAAGILTAVFVLVTDIRGRLADLSAEFRGEMGAFRTELNGFRTELNGLRAELDDLRTEMREGFRQVNARIDGLDRDVQALTERVFRNGKDR
jgi:hypothetical protein